MINKEPIKTIYFLRTLAVLLVVFYHLDIYIFKNGFIGVDIFLTLSGFLMTKIMVEEKPSIKEFYLRRIKRILPLYQCFIFFVFFLSLLFFNFNQLEKTFNSLGFSQTFSSNVYFWQSTKDYWAEGTVLNPLLHTWSLSLEVQYYFILPLIFLYKRLKNFLILVVFCFSLLFIEFYKYSDASFYLIFSRISQFIIGGFFYYIYKKKIRTDFSDLYFLFFLIFILIINIKLNLYIFPHYYGILISILTGIFLTFNKFNFFNFLLDNKIIKFFSNISYSLFLFHYPLIIFYNYYIDRNLNVYEKAIIFITSVVLSYFTYCKIEKKFNIISINKFYQNYLYKIFLPISLFIISISLLNHYTDLTKNLQNQKNIKFLESLEKITPNRNLLGESFVQDSKKEKKYTIIFGDSHAQDVYFSFIFNDKKNNYIYIPSNLECAEIINRDKNFIKEKIYELIGILNWNEKLKKDCNVSFKSLNTLSNRGEIENFYVAFKWNEEEIYYLDFILDKALNYSNQVSVFSRRISIPNISSAVYKVGLNVNKLNEYFNRKKDLHEKMNFKLKKKITESYPRIKYIDINKFICPKLDSCEFFYKEYPMYLDRTHFSIYGLQYIQNIKKNNLK